MQYHERMNHSGVNDTLPLLHETYWIFNGKYTVKQSLNICVTCLKCKGLPYYMSTTSDLLWNECVMTHLLHISELNLLVQFILICTIHPTRPKSIPIYLHERQPGL